MFCAQHSMEELLPYLEDREADFRSIGYESVSMSIALKELQHFPGPSHQPILKEWLSFLEGPATKHKAQVYIGLGWAIAKLDIPFSEVVQNLEARFHHRVADGCGYYDGSFRQRQTILGLQVPSYLPASALPIYYQGVGRSLWYSCGADIEKIRKKINGFSAEFQPDLWRGLGIAIAYVGGCDEKALKIIMEDAGINGIQLACGAALAAGSRLTASAMTLDTDHCSRTWYKLQEADELNVFSARAMNEADKINEDNYLQWIMQIEEGLAKSFLLVN